MSYPLNNVTTADTYTAANTIDVVALIGKFAGQLREADLDELLCVRANIDVTNAAIFWQVKLGLEPFSRPEVFMPPGSRSLNRRLISGLRVRSGTPAKPAQVTFELVRAEET